MGYRPLGAGNFNLVFKDEQGNGKAKVMALIRRLIHQSAQLGFGIKLIKNCCHQQRLYIMD
tara:strand:- start:241 stop:423 length:183 start_codon:yes stop_codon:yes gene_type:complete